jgi:hypothetical protein
VAKLQTNQHKMDICDLTTKKWQSQIISAAKTQKKTSITMIVAFWDVII